MTTFILVVALLAGAAFVTFALIKQGKIKDANNNNIPDAIEEKVEEVKEVVAEVKEKAKKVKAVADKVVKAKKSAKKATPKN